MNWRSKGNTNKSQEDLTGFVMLAIAVLFAVSVAVVMYRLNLERVDRDNVTLCRVDSYLTQETVLLLDATNSFTESHQETVLNHLREMLRTSEEDEKFTLYSLNDNTDTFQPALSICNPGDGQNLNPLINNPTLADEKWDEFFYQRIVGAVQNQMIINEAGSSPIMEMFKFVGIRSIFESSAPTKRIVIVSDMVEHTINYSQYTQSLDFQTLKDSPYFREVRPSLDGVDVEILYIERPELAAIQKMGHIRFWEEFISEASGQVISLDPIN